MLIPSGALSPVACVWSRAMARVHAFNLPVDCVAFEAAEEEQQARRQKRAELMSTKLHAAGKEVAEDGFRLDISVF